MNCEFGWSGHLSKVVCQRSMTISCVMHLNLNCKRVVAYECDAQHVYTHLHHAFSGGDVSW